MVKTTIDDSTLDTGGITRSELRRKIGRNHVSYIRRVDEIVGQLLGSGEYGLNEGRIVAIVRDSNYTNRIPHRVGPRRGRPRKEPDKPIIRELDGRLTDFIPMPVKPEKDSKKNKNNGD